MADQSPSKLSMDFMGCPSSEIMTGSIFEPAVMVSTNPSPSKKSKRSSSVNPACLIAVASLLAQTNNGYVSLPGGVLSGQRLYDNLHQLPTDYLGRLSPEFQDNALGYVSFPSLAIQHPGKYRIRITLLRMPEARNDSGQAEPLLAVDSDLISVSPSDE